MPKFDAGQEAMALCLYTHGTDGGYCKWIWNATDQRVPLGHIGMQHYENRFDIPAPLYAPALGDEVIVPAGWFPEKLNVKPTQVEMMVREGLPVILRVDEDMWTFFQKRARIFRAYSSPGWEGVEFSNIDPRYAGDLRKLRSR